MQQQAHVSKFDNISAEMLADMIGDQDAVEKEEAAYAKSLKDEAKRRGIEMASGARWKITVATSTSNRLDTKGLRELLGDALDPYNKPVQSTTLRIKSVFAQGELD